MKSAQSAVGLSISLFKPTVHIPTPSYIPAGTMIDDSLASKITGYRHTIDAFGGYTSASLNINYNLVHAEDWIDRLGYHVEVSSPSLVKIWEGFINKVVINVGALSVTRGPLMDIGNRVRVVYSTVDATISPPVVGGRARTADAEDSASQDRYGVIQKAVSVGGVAVANASILRDGWIGENSLPETGQTFNSSSQATPSVTVELLGYFSFLKQFLYNDTTFGNREISLILKDIFAEEATNVNALFGDVRNIVTPAAPVSINRYKNKDLTAIDRIKTCVSHGDANFTRYLFGIYNDREPFYDAIPSEIEYFQAITDSKQRVTSVGGAEVKPWEVLPGKWLEYTDFLVGATTPSDFRNDPRIQFVESVTYTAPWGLSHSGIKISTMRQRLARMGLAGAGV